MKRKPNNQEPLDENGKAHGEWLIYNRNGELDYRGNYVHGVAHGLFEWHNNDRKIWYRGCRNMGKEVGYWCWYNDKKYYLCLI